MPRPIKCGEANHANPDEICWVDVRWWREETHSGVHGWAREPKQVQSTRGLDARLRERLPRVAAHLDRLREGAQ